MMIKKTTLYKSARKIHKWCGLLLGLQLLAWVAGGVVMSAIPINLVHGDHLVDRQQHSVLPAQEYRYSIDQLLAGVTGAVKSIQYTAILGQAAYKIVTGDGVFWFNATNGQVIEQLSQQQIEALAKSYYVGDGAMVESRFLIEGPLEIGKRSNLWQVRFDDSVDTTLYLAQHNGELIRVRSDIWRFYDFFWMLHIMDYTERSDSNNWLLIIASILATGFSISGLILLFQVFRKRDFFPRKITLSSRLKN